ncbi:MAG: hypothetical protein OXF84_08600 [Bacteroidetes bacterium]|nr:hypothetical protein [Bacteroidota bacterium]
MAEGYGTGRPPRFVFAGSGIRLEVGGFKPKSGKKTDIAPGGLGLLLTPGQLGMRQQLMV